MRQIIAMGGGGFSMEPDNPLLDKYILNAVNTDKPKICFLPTASGDSEGYINRFYKFFSNLNCTPSHLSLFKLPTSDLEDYILEKDIIYVGGGNTKNLLTLWREWEIDNFLKKAWDNEIVLAGLSAGSICWFEQGITDSIPGRLSSISCLGFLKGSNCPHYDGEIERKPSYHRLIKSKQIIGGIAADDGVALHFFDQKIYTIVSSRVNANAYQIKLINDRVHEEKLEAIYLGSNRDIYGAGY